MPDIDFTLTDAFQCRAIVGPNGGHCNAITRINQGKWDPPCKNCGLRPKVSDYSIKYVAMPGPSVQVTVNGEWASSSEVVYN
ncbi:hypothetical protein JDV02_004795 [Purpureocillium takamizusanense]|uniref:Uncharacterized protein n=1 Tax=Purpureocillium takamizusanense TaxID=2060973 RepID=A0A9Q8VB49_9HYPO|nr:uncharacterized protein JDV02_004795 [Purpureocillium takamizusanense]UNI18531.1 hypothetical protein JDV02_004795 [Purpureocillium takamizusanense]